MKHLYSLGIVLIIILEISMISTTSLKGKETNLKSKSNSHYKSTFTMEQVNTLWKTLFKTSRGSKCPAPTLEKLLKREDVFANNALANSAWGKSSSSFAWIKKWGNGPVAYLMDYIDPVFQKQFVAEAVNIYKEALKFKPDDSSKYEDKFKLSLLPGAKGKPVKTEADFAKLGPKFDKAIHDKSVNSVQLNELVRKWKWYVPDDQDPSTDIGADLMVKYDVNGDGRLSPRELILAAIDNNSKSKDELLCLNCFFLLRKKFEAMFLYFDCTNEGFLVAEKLWNKFPELVRKTKKYDIYAAGNSDTIRTNAINDFILKNQNAVDGAVTKDEFSMGLLYAYWDRQTSDTNIVGDDSRNLKKLRWKNEVTDIVNVNYLKEKAELEKNS